MTHALLETMSDEEQSQTIKTCMRKVSAGDDTTITAPARQCTGTEVALQSDMKEVSHAVA